MTRKQIGTLVAIIIAMLALVTGCDSHGNSNKSNAAAAHSQARTNQINTNKDFVAPTIKNHMDYQNFYKSQELYDNPNTIQWCTSTWGNASAPLFTVPVAGKLTSSTVSLDPTTQAKVMSGGNDHDTTTYNPELPSADSMFHGNPPPYRYGFTPGGQYVDFFNMPTFCTTALTNFQRQATKVSLAVDPAVAAAQKQAEADLAKCNAGFNTNDAAANAKSCAAAQHDLEAVVGQ